jgi:hypothetical protein
MQAETFALDPARFLPPESTEINQEENLSQELRARPII